MNNIAIIYVTCKNSEEAEKIAIDLLEKKLIACANIFPITSVYIWDNKVNKDSEVTLILKTKETLFDKIKENVKKNHSYSVPCIIKINGESDSEFFKFINENTI